jgi:hypothetical protein
MIRLWATIAIKLGITQEEALLLHGFLRGWLNDLARRRANLLVNQIVERFELQDDDYTASYARMLLAKGVLTPTEAEVFAGNYHEDISAGGGPPSGPETATQQPDEPGLVRIGRTGKPTRGPSAA